MFLFIVIMTRMKTCSTYLSTFCVRRIINASVYYMLDSLLIHKAQTSLKLITILKASVDIGFLYIDNSSSHFFLHNINREHKK